MEVPNLLLAPDAM